MTFTRVNVGGWALYETLTSTQMNNLDINVSRALDGYAGGNYSPSSDLKVHGKIIGEDEAYRSFVFPMTLGIPEVAGQWVFDFDNYRWYSDGTAVRELLFSLNRFLQNDLLMRTFYAYVHQENTSTGTNRMSLELIRASSSAAPTITSLDKSYYWASAGSSGAGLITQFSGIHDGGDGQSAMTDSLKNWQTDYFVGATIYNITDGSSGTITANTSDTITATLSGGTNNDWDDDDTFRIEADVAIETDAYDYYLKLVSENSAHSDLLFRLISVYVEGDYLVVP